MVFLPQMLYSVLKWRMYESSYCLEDYREAHRIPPSARLFLPLRKRLYGVLLKESPDGASIVQEWCMAGPGSLDAAEMVSISEIPGTLQIKILPKRLHDSRILASSGHGREIHETFSV